MIKQACCKKVHLDVEFSHFICIALGIIMAISWHTWSYRKMVLQGTLAPKSMSCKWGKWAIFSVESEATGWVTHLTLPRHKPRDCMVCTWNMLVWNPFLLEHCVMTLFQVLDWLPYISNFQSCLVTQTLFSYEKTLSPIAYNPCFMRYSLQGSWESPIRQR